MDSLRQNFRFAVRQLGRNPGFTVTVILILSLAIGANTAIFSLVNALLLQNLPYSHPERMGTIYEQVTGPNPYDERSGIDGEKWELLRDNVPALISAVSGTTSGVNLQADSHTRFVQNGRISAHYLDVLGLQPMMGRNFSLEEDRPHGPRAAILSHDLWRNVFSSDRNILGRAVLLKGEPYTVIGVLPESATTPLNAGVYTALQPSREGEGGGTNYEAIVRLRDGASWQAANVEMNRAWSSTAQRLQNHNPGARIAYYSVPLQKAETDALRPQVLALMLSSGFILLIACANLAGLTLVRVLRRTSEVATRLALGASQWQIQRQFWIENLLLALVGGVLSIGIGFLALRGLLLLLPEHFLPVANVALDSHVLAFTLALSLLTSVLFGMLPALVTRKVDLRSSKASRTVAGGGKLRLRQTLIAGEVALTVVLLAAFGLLVRTLIHLETLAPGFNPNGLIVAKASLDEIRFHDSANFRKLINESTDAMRRIPGVQSAAVGLSLPYERALNDAVTIRDGKETGQQMETDVVYVSRGYSETLQMPLLAGRFFTDADGPDGQSVAIVNQTFARKFYGEESPIGRYLNKDTVIVGEVADVSVSSGLYRAPLMSEQAMYVPAAQMSAPALSMIHVWFQPNWIVRAEGPTGMLKAEMQRSLASVNPNLPFSGFYTMKDLLNRTLATQRIEVALLGAMAALALLLSAIGIFALVANMVIDRTREIGIRMALGSTAGRAMAQVGRFGVTASVLGFLLGVVLCGAMLRIMQSALYGISFYDLPTMAGVAITMVLVTLLATAVPTLRITRIDPAQVLREE